MLPATKHNSYNPVTYRNNPYRDVVTILEPPRRDVDKILSSESTELGRSVNSCFSSFAPDEGLNILSVDSTTYSPSLGSDDTENLLADSSPLSLQNIYIPSHSEVIVGLKYGMQVVRTFFPTKVKSIIIFEGDRGYDCGTVLGRAVGEKSPGRMLPRAIRVATKADLESLERRKEKEASVLQCVWDLAAREDFTAKIVDVMYQLDGNKVTVVVQRVSKSFVDFRRLQRVLFTLLRCRIWFAYLDEIDPNYKLDTPRCNTSSGRSISAKS